MFSVILIVCFVAVFQYIKQVLDVHDRIDFVFAVMNIRRILISMLSLIKVFLESNPINHKNSLELFSRNIALALFILCQFIMSFQNFQTLMH